MEDAMIPRGSHEIIEALTAEDFETASIRSAAPSYRSEAPTLHYTVPYTGGSLLPPYTAPPAGSADRVVVPGGAGRHRSGPSYGPSGAAASRRAASGPNGGSAFGNQVQSARGGSVPNLGQFRIPSWSTITTSPNARLYHSVALRRVAAAEHASAAAEIGGLMRRLAVMERMEQEEAAASRRMAEAAASRAAAAAGNGARPASNNAAAGGNAGRSAPHGNSNNGSNSNDNMWRNAGTFRPLEDPYLVGESAARRTRSERITRENQAHAEEALAREDRRWDWFLGSFARPSAIPASRRRLHHAFSSH
ncbi:hypothetical protein F503_03523 [Ophiostoma piceae UAMH 11346]|uniref:Uncharacterized protein n=1 Tax=Ophiostoma piceae (strain UAMH 11346) TaxID=1262450 RepID=S3BYA0_OPHP1|nr:hypothetical protein F503_03523 [Ophiostoma piceae UAMH 11346]